MSDYDRPNSPMQDSYDVKVEPRSASRSRSRSPRRASRSRSPARRESSRRRSRSRSRSKEYRRKRSGSPRRRSRSPRRRSRSPRRRSRSPRRRRQSPRGGRHEPNKEFHGTREAPEMSNILGVFGLSLRTREVDIEEVFSDFGSLEKVTIVYDHRSNRSRGFGFVYFKDQADATRARDALNGIEIDDRQIRVDYSVTHRPHTPTPGEYMGERKSTGSGRYDRDRRGGDYHRSRRRSRSPPRRRYYRSRSRSRSWSR
ncbi:hypothetical protein EDC96DRAFT_571480 [Choanephora cucurbitarum]|nr:hypothetical protein EDC96DRAFT_571480 [Choanephora cucurbitarum]